MTTGNLTEHFSDFTQGDVVKIFFLFNATYYAFYVKAWIITGKTTYKATFILAFLWAATMRYGLYCGRGIKTVSLIREDAVSSTLVSDSWKKVDPVGFSILQDSAME